MLQQFLNLYHRKGVNEVVEVYSWFGDASYLNTMQFYNFIYPLLVLIIGQETAESPRFPYLAL